MDKFWEWLSWKLPRRLVYWATVRLIVYGTSGKWGTEIMSEAKALNLLTRWKEGKNVPPVS